MHLKDLKLTPKRLKICEKFSFENSNDILSFYPFRYEEYQLKHYCDFKEGESVVFECELVSYPSTFRYGKRSTTRFQVSYEEEIISVTIFNRPWIRDLHENDRLIIVGKYDGSNKVTASNYYTKNLDQVLGIIPVYSTKEGITQNEMRKLIEFTYKKTEDYLNETIPLKLVESHRLISYKDAIHNIHFPKDSLSLKQAISRIKYEEFLRFYVSLDIIKSSTKSDGKQSKQFDEKLVRNFVDGFGFELTKDQKSCVDEILNDLKSTRSMYRLIQGDVGSGKTAVAAVALFANCLAGYQGALMAPTEILAVQHYDYMKPIFEKYGMSCSLLCSDSPDSKTIKRDIADGNVDIIIGTHALFSDDVIYKKLGMVIADEQHRFGVKQRRKLKEKGKMTDFLLMSATPIPRTLASSIYGDMDVSTIETMPSGRKGCETYLIQKNSITSILPKLKKELDEGRQIYIVAAAIEKNENYNAKDAEGLYNSLAPVFEPYSVGLLHGRMDSETKDNVMNRFKNNEIQVLVSTTVIEVGVNVKNATIMIVYNADRFGLSQLHQLRGRVQRGNFKGKCYLLTDSKDAEAIKRMKVLENTNDGFKISYEDLKMRGPGDILGTRQSGVPAFVMGNLIEDARFIEAARKDAAEIMRNSDDEEYAEYREKIRDMATKNYVD